jgi:exonuclease SbcD
VLFAGSVERVDFAEEHELKSFLVVDVVDGRATIERIPTPARRFVTLHSLDALVDTDIEAAVVRFLDAEDDPAVIRAHLESYGPFEITEIRPFRAESAAAEGAMSESLAPAAALEAYFAADPDRDALVARGRQLLEEAAA